MKQNRVNHKYDESLRGISRTRLYYIWSHMKQRCYNENDIKYHDYGERGIRVCDEWIDDFQEFRKWAINNGYEEHLTLDRIDMNGNYEPSNCRWATYRQQANNTRKNHNLSLFGETHTISEWSRIVGIGRATIERRINKYNWTVYDALTVEPKMGRRKVRW